MDEPVVEVGKVLGEIALAVGICFLGILVTALLAAWKRHEDEKKADREWELEQEERKKQQEEAYQRALRRKHDGLELLRKKAEILNTCPGLKEVR